MEGLQGITNGPENESQIARKRPQNHSFLQIPSLQISQNVTQVNRVRVLHGGLKGMEKVSDYICRHIDEGRIFVGCEGDELALADAVRIVGSKPFLYSSDFPHEVNSMTCKQEIKNLLENEKLTDVNKNAILSGNAGRLYAM